MLYPSRRRILRVLRMSAAKPGIQTQPWMVMSCGPLVVLMTRVTSPVPVALWLSPLMSVTLIAVGIQVVNNALFRITVTVLPLSTRILYVVLGHCLRSVRTPAVIRHWALCPISFLVIVSSVSSLPFFEERLMRSCTGASLSSTVDAFRLLVFEVMDCVEVCFIGIKSCSTFGAVSPSRLHPYSLNSPSSTTVSRAGGG